jgi:transposase, IS30 family
MPNYKRLSIEEREEISRLIAQEEGVRAISRSIGRAASTISREIRRLPYGRWGRLKYRAVASDSSARRRARSRRKGKRKLTLDPELLAVVKEKLSLYWSPVQIAEFLKRNYEDPAMHVSAETIYSYIYVLPRGALRKELSDQLRRAHKKRRIRGRSWAGRPSNLEDMLSIEERPKEVADRIIPGHWEGDMIIGGAKEQTALGTLVERTTRTVILVPLKNKTAQEVRTAFAREIKKLPKELRLTLTYDQGREMAEHKLFTKETKMKVFFAHPRSPWERGTNENTNGLLRQFFPKSIDFRKVSKEEIKRVQDLMNGRPRKTLNWRTPQEAMQELLR